MIKKIIGVMADVFIVLIVMSLFVLGVYGALSTYVLPETKMRKIGRHSIKERIGWFKSTSTYVDNKSNTLSLVGNFISVEKAHGKTYVITKKTICIWNDGDPKVQLNLSHKEKLEFVASSENVYEITGDGDWMHVLYIGKKGWQYSKGRLGDSVKALFAKVTCKKKVCAFSYLVQIPAYESSAGEFGMRTLAKEEMRHGYVKPVVLTNLRI
ncbi:hypothetical protein KKH43_02985 [Patescibacteria group bacterium]|nr:hypothetical protein [Patescibacteria group bacterium]